MALVCTLVDIHRQEPFGSNEAAAFLGIAGITGSFPPIGFLTFFLCTITPFRRLFACVKQRICSCPLSSCNDDNNGHIENVRVNNSDNSELPDHTLNANDYDGKIITVTT